MLFKRSVLLFMFFAPLAVFAKEGTEDSTHATKKEYKNEFGLDMIYFLNLFKTQYDPGSENFMVFAFDRHLKKERIFRFFLTTGLINTNVKDDTLPSTKNFQLDIAALPGFGWERHITKHWECFYGIQAKIVYGTNKDVRGNYNNTGVQTTYYTNWLLGPSGFAGVKYNINDRISLQLETDVSLLYNYDLSGFSNDIFPSQDHKTLVTGFTTEYLVPKTILLNFKF